VIDVKPLGQHEHHERQLVDINLPRAYALVFGLMFLFTGIAAIFQSRSLALTTVIVFPMNLPHGLVHVAFGLGGIYALIAHREVGYVRTMAAILAVLFLSGNLQQPLFGVLPVGGPDMFLHGLSGLAAGFSLHNRAPRRLVLIPEHWRLRAKVIDPPA